MLHVAHSVWVGVQVWHLEFDVSAAAVVAAVAASAASATAITITVFLGMSAIAGFRNVFPLSETTEYR